MGRVLGVLDSIDLSSTDIQHLTAIEDESFEAIVRAALPMAKDADLEKFDLEFKRFLALRYFFPDDLLGIPFQLDLIWHNFILSDTKNYFDFCQIVFGGPLHHKQGDEAQSCAVTVAQYVSRFGPDESGLWVETMLWGACSP